jgi:hypothetical protein
MASTTFPTTVDTFSQAPETNLELDKVTGAVKAMETLLASMGTGTVKDGSGTLTLRTSATSIVGLPTSGTAATLAGAETLTNKRVQVRVAAGATGATGIDPATTTLVVCATAWDTAKTLVLSAGAVAGDSVILHLTGYQTGTATIADAAGSIAFLPSKKGSVRFEHNGIAWMRTGSHYAES